MKFVDFDYHAPETVEEVVDLLGRYGDDAKILAGGQSLMPLMALRVADPEVLIDINGVHGIDTVERVDRRIRVGALVRHRRIEKLPNLTDGWGIVSDALAMIGHVAVRNRGTVLGSLAHADPAAEWPAIARALEAEITAESPRGNRTIPADGFFDSYLTNALEPDEIATSVAFTLPEGQVGSVFEELARRHGDFAIAGAGAVVVLADGLIADARLALIGAGSTPVRARDAEAALVGRAPSDDVFAEAAEIVYDSVAPRGDAQGSAEYRRKVLRVISRRALRSASARAEGVGQ